MALRRRTRAAVLAPPAPSPAPPAHDAWTAEPGFAPVALEEPPAGEPGLWVAAAEPIDVTDSTIDMPALAAMPRRRAARAGRAALTLTLVLGCAGAAVAASGVLRSKPETSPPPTVGDSSVVAASRPHRAKPAHHKRAVHRHHRRHHAARHHTVVAPRRLVAAAPAHTTPAAPAPARSPVHHVSSPAPAPAPKPVASEPVATSPQPAASAPSGEPGRQPPPSP